MNFLNDNFILHISYENVDYNTINSFTAKKFLLNKVRYNYHLLELYYMS